jgi:hypothetical protein
MKVTMFWHGGSGYAMFCVHSERDAEVFHSIREAKEAFARRGSGWDSYYPCVDTDPENGASAWLFLGGKPKDHPIVGQEYPCRVMLFGNRGGVVVERA